MKFLIFLWILIVLLAGYYYVKFVMPSKRSAPSCPTQYQLDKHKFYNYYEYLEALWECVSNNYVHCGLSRPVPTTLPGQYKASAQHYAEWSEQVTYDAKRGVVYHYYFDRESHVEGSIHTGMKITFTTVPVSHMVQQLNCTFANYCIQRGLPVKSILLGRSAAKGRVEFVIGPFNFEPWYW